MSYRQSGFILWVEVELISQPYTVTDGNLVTGQNPPSSASTAAAVIKLLNQVPA